VFIIGVEYRRENVTCNLSHFWVKSLDEYGIETIDTVTIYGDTGEVKPVWYTPYRKFILEHNRTRLHLIFASFTLNFLKIKEKPISIK